MPHPRTATMMRRRAICFAWLWVTLARQRSTRRIALAPLSADAVGVLAAGSGLEPAALFQLTGGNPFYVSEVVQAGMNEVPASARDAVLARVVGLSSESRELLDVAALTGARVEPQLLEAVMPGRPSAIDELTASGLLAGDGPWLRFRHEIARPSCVTRRPLLAARRNWGRTAKRRPSSSGRCGSPRTRIRPPPPDYTTGLPTR